MFRANIDTIYNVTSLKAKKKESARKRRERKNIEQALNNTPDTNSRTSWSGIREVPGSNLARDTDYLDWTPFF
jgi:cobalamin-dependent methionine synthase I